MHSSAETRRIFPVSTILFVRTLTFSTIGKAAKLFCSPNHHSFWKILTIDIKFWLTGKKRQDYWQLRQRMMPPRKKIKLPRRKEPPSLSQKRKLWRQRRRRRRRRKQLRKSWMQRRKREMPTCYRRSKQTVLPRKLAWRRNPRVR